MQQPNAESARPYQFHLAHLFYVMAMAFSGGVIAPPWGMLAVVLVLGLWAMVWSGRMWGAVLFVLLCCIVALVIYPALRRTAGYNRCSENLQNISMALQLYHAVHGVYPPAVIADAEGKPMHSWRVLLLPQLDEESRYLQYDFSEPWDGPHNSQLAAEVPSIYQCWEQSLPDEHTSYLAVTASPATWGGSQNWGASNEIDDPDNTIVLIQADRSVHWMEPSDLDLDEAIALLSEQKFEDVSHPTPSFWFQYPQRRYVATADAAVWRIWGYADKQTCRDLLTTNDGRQVNVASPKHGVQVRRIHLANWIRAGVFGFLIVLPFGWVFKKNRYAKSPPATSTS